MPLFYAPNKTLESVLEEKYESTVDIFLDTGRPTRQAHSYVKSEKKRILEIQAGTGCDHYCRGCRDKRELVHYDETLSMNPHWLDLAFEVLEIGGPFKEQDKWRIQVSGSVTDPMTMGSACWERLIDLSVGHDIILHTASAMSPASFQYYFGQYFSSPHFASGGKFVFVRSLNAPVFFVDGLTGQAVKKWAAQFGKLPVALFEHEFYNVLLDHLWLKKELDSRKVPDEKFHVVAKQVVNLEDHYNDVFSIDDFYSILYTQHSISTWSKLASTYFIGPAFFSDTSKRIPLQEKFEYWIHMLQDSFEFEYPNIDLMYRRFCARPQRTDKSGVSDYQYTLNKGGFFTPCDYSELPIPSLPRIDDPSITKSQIDEAYSRVSYHHEPCMSCHNRNCTHDYYE